MRMAFKPLFVRAAGLMSLTVRCLAAVPDGPPPSAEQLSFFEEKIRPVLVKRCYKCHSADAEKLKGELLMDSRAGLLKGGETGPAIVPGDPEKSLLITAIRYEDPDLKMPPKSKLSDAEIGDLVRWVKLGAPDPRGPAQTAAVPEKRDLWSLHPIRRPALPEVKQAAWVRNPIDQFILARLEDKGLAPSPEADRRTLIRRLRFDLLGLPPTPEEADDFVADGRPDAYEKLVERLLASPHYGERWARHWLDIAHYADTHGFERDQRRDNAWPYRDYVIRSLNADKPYPQVLREQIAGDVLAPNDKDAVTATGFLAAGPWDYVGQVETKSDVLRRAARADDLDDMVTQVITATVGLTINCARCHDHKIDPISQADYYRLWSVFAGVKRGDRPINPEEGRRYAAEKVRLEQELKHVTSAIGGLEGRAFDLADVVGGGNGWGTGKRGGGIDPRSGKPQPKILGYLDKIRANEFARGDGGFIDGVIIPDGRAPVPISSTGLSVTKVPRTSANGWDAIRNGPVNSQFSTKLGDVDYNADGHSLLTIHANAAITFDLAAIRRTSGWGDLRFRAVAGYGGSKAGDGADFRIYVDGDLKAGRDHIGRDDGAIPVDVAIPASARFLTLMSTDGGNGIGHDQIFYGDPHLAPAKPPALAADRQAEVERLTAEKVELQRQAKALTEPGKVYAVVSETPPAIKLLKRGDPESPKNEVTPGAVACVRQVPSDLGTAQTPEGERRRALAEWIVHPDNPLTRRVLVNRLWHYHFGKGIVDTPSDFGLGGGAPTHPELLDWLADEFGARGWSLKAMHRLIVTSATYRQSSATNATFAQTDADNRLLWRMNPHRLDAESLRDAVLATTGKLNLATNGPGYRDFAYQEAYAPIYKYVTPDEPELWRRSIYRFVVRSTPHQLLTTLDSPNPANLTPARIATTTALQSLALLNNDFLLHQARYFAERIEREAGTLPQAQAQRAFRLAFTRAPSADERRRATEFIARDGLFQLCRVLLNANEFVYVD